jgi:menaquinone-dependent protoporphyrinogen IX oxidase
LAKSWARTARKWTYAGFFGGKLELYRLNLVQKLFVLLAIQAQPADFRHWPDIREWAASLRTAL